MFCTNCGKEIENSSIFCTHCGAKQSVEAPSKENISKIEPIAPVPEIVENAQGDVTQRTDLPQPATPNVGGLATTPIGPSPVVPPINEPKPAPSVNPESPASGSSNGKKKLPPIIMAGIALVAIVLLILLLGGKGGYKEYKDLIQDYYTAIYKEDFNALLKCYDKDDQKDMKEDKKDIKEELEELKEIYDDKYDKGWQKKIKVKSRDKMDTDDGVTYYRVNIEIDDSSIEYIMVKKYKDRFYIDSDSDNF